MKIKHICIRSFCGAQDINTYLDAPVTIVAGRNGSGKSSLVEAIRMALTGQHGRVELKKDYAHLVTDGAKKGFAHCHVDDLENPYCLTIPSGAAQHADTPFLPFVLESSLFIGLTANERRSMLFKLTGCKITPELIVAKLLNRNCNSGKVKDISAHLKDGMESASKIAKTKATESKGAWKAVTNETYGEVKAATWEAPKVKSGEVPDIADLQSKAVTWQGHADRVNQELGAYQLELKQLAESNARIAALHTKASMVDRIKAKIAEDKKQQALWAEKIADAETKAQGTVQPSPLECPHCSGHVLFEHGHLTAFIQSDAKAPDSDAIKNLPEYRNAHALHTAALVNSERDLIQAEVAAEELGILGAVKTSEVIQKAIDESRTKLTHCHTQLKDFQAEIAKAQQLDRAITASKDATAKAMQHHTDVIEWSAIGDALAPDGIPAEILASALQPFNDRLRDSATRSGWIQVAVSADMQITANGRPYSLLCESEKWRADAMLTEAISHLSGLKLILLDRMDVLDIPSRGQMLKWLNGLATSKEIDTAIVCGTLKEPFNAPNSNFQSFWLEHGVIAGLKAA